MSGEYHHSRTTRLHPLDDLGKVRLEGFEPPTPGSEDWCGVFLDVRFCPNLQSTNGMLSVADCRRSPTFGSFIPKLKTRNSRFQLPTRHPG